MYRFMVMQFCSFAVFEGKSALLVKRVTGVSTITNRNERKFSCNTISHYKIDYIYIESINKKL